MMERTQKQTKNLTEGSPARLILEFAVPMFLGLLFQQFYSMVDTMIVGKFLGMKPLAGVGATGSLNFMVIGFCIGVCNGFAIPHRNLVPRIILHFDVLWRMLHGFVLHFLLL